ncbi:unnamed protein product [Pleuronectes platessa]|uniref:Uncharacterized protein n=1 Tax=Pleuronectes platessa TaxID=8262 RepID=A0A9N7V015_PLEPL|nr:unnamed protein product [Pleuronectes platessa]
MCPMPSTVNECILKDHRGEEVRRGARDCAFGESHLLTQKLRERARQRESSVSGVPATPHRRQALIRPSMYSILHSTGVCVMCQSDFSGVKSKTHGICHLEEKTTLPSKALLLKIKMNVAL